MSCRFCQIVKENTVQVFRDELVSVFLDIDPISHGHVLIIPNAHYLDIDELPEGTLHRIMAVAQKVVGLYKTHLAPPGYSMMQNGGYFNDTGHFHLHVFPRYNEKHFNFTYEDDSIIWRDRAEMEQQLQQWLQVEETICSSKEAFPVLQTERLVLNQLQFSDSKQVVQLAGSEKIASTTLNIPHPYHEQDAESWIKASYLHFEQGTQYTFAIREAGSPNLIGAIGLILTPNHQRAATGYWLGEPYWNNGYTTEALAAMLRFGFTNLKLNKIYATHLLSNLASGKVMIKNGMILEGELMEHYVKGDMYRSVKQYRLLKKEWEAIQISSILLTFFWFFGL